MQRPYYILQKIDRTLLEKYFERRKYPNATLKKDHDEGSEKPLKLNSPGSVSSNPSSSGSASSYASSASSPSSLSTASRSPSHGEDDDDIDETSRIKSRRKRNKSKELLKKRKATASVSHSAETSASPSRRLAKKKTLDTSKTASKTAKKDKLKKSNGHLKVKAAVVRLRSKSLEKTLNKMHTSTKETNKPPKMVSASSNGATRVHKTELASDKSGLKTKTNFNLSSLTSLPHENLDTQLLKDCKISASFYKQINSHNNGRSLSANQQHQHMNHGAANANANAKNTPAKSGPNAKSSVGKSATETLDVDNEKHLRKELGDSIVNAVDAYFSKIIRFLDRFSRFKNEKKIEFSTHFLGHFRLFLPNN